MGRPRFSRANSKYRKIVICCAFRAFSATPNNPPPCLRHIEAWKNARASSKYLCNLPRISAPPLSARIVVVTAPPLLPGTSWTAMRIPRALQSCHNGAGSPPRPSMAASKMGQYGVHTAQRASKTSPPPPKKNLREPCQEMPKKLTH